MEGVPKCTLPLPFPKKAFVLWLTLLIFSILLGPWGQWWELFPSLCLIGISQQTSHSWGMLFLPSKPGKHPSATALKTVFIWLIIFIYLTSPLTWFAYFPSCTCSPSFWHSTKPGSNQKPVSTEDGEGNMDKATNQFPRPNSHGEATWFHCFFLPGDVQLYWPLESSLWETKNCQ